MSPGTRETCRGPKHGFGSKHQNSGNLQCNYNYRYLDISKKVHIQITDGYDTWDFPVAVLDYKKERGYLWVSHWDSCEEKWLILHS